MSEKWIAVTWVDVERRFAGHRYVGGGHYAVDFEDEYVALACSYGDYTEAQLERARAWLESEKPGVARWAFVMSEDETLNDARRMTLLEYKKAQNG